MPSGVKSSDFALLKWVDRPWDISTVAILPYLMWVTSCKTGSAVYPGNLITPPLGVRQCLGLWAWLDYKTGCSATGKCEAPDRSSWWRVAPTGSTALYYRLSVNLLLIGTVGLSYIGWYTMGLGCPYT